MIEKKIGILTFHCTNNYGAVLQAYALKEIIKEVYLDYDVNVIDYRCETTISKYKFIDIIKQEGLLKAFLYHRSRVKLNNKFDIFRANRLNLSRTYYDIQELKNDIDTYKYIVSGSDQVWNTKWTGTDTVYFQDFYDNKSKKVSYAISFGFSQIKSEMLGFYKDKLSSFNNISVRELSGKEMLKKQLNLESKLDLDPTLVVEKNKWDKIAIIPKEKNYILLYMVPKQKSVIDFATKLSKKTGLKIIMISKAIRPLGIKHINNASPEEFLGWFQNAEYVVTNSFHGTAFSIINKKKFYVELNTRRGFNTRSKNLLDICGIATNENEQFVDATRVDWKTVETNLARYIETSKDTIRNFGK